MYDNQTHRRVQFDDFSHLERYLYKLSTVPGYKPQKGQSMKGASPLLSPAIYKEGETRANANVIHWDGWCALDVDDHEWTADNFRSELENWIGQYYYICYSTASSTKQKPKFRLVFPLTETVDAEKIKHFWYALNVELNSVVDKQTKDLSRMFYVPADYPNAYNFIFTNEGDYINPQTLMKKHKYVEMKKTLFGHLPEGMRKALIEHRKNQLTNTDIKWSSYRDCPFVNKKILQDYTAITDTGWYHRMYEMMVAIAGNALRMKYPITATQIAGLCREIDNDNGGWYSKRPLDRESENAIAYAYSKV